MKLFLLFCLALFPDIFAGNILLIVGNSNGTTPVNGFSIGDRFIRDRLQNQLGHKVEVVPDSVSQDSLIRLASHADLVIVLESVTSIKLTNKLKTIPIPLLNFEAFIQDDMGMTATGPPGDPGAPDKFALGVVEMTDRISILNSTHPLAAGLSGLIKVYSQPKSITWGKVAPTAEIVATLATDSTGATIYLYRKGVRLFDGTVAAGIRIGFFLEDDNITGTPNLMTREGLMLFDRAVAFTLANETLGIHPLFLPEGRKSRNPAVLHYTHFILDLCGRQLPITTEE
jgi:hypothetical protein